MRAASWWDNLHWRQWRIADRADLRQVIDSARHAAHEELAPLLDSSILTGCKWTEDKQRILAVLDTNLLTSLLTSTNQSSALSVSLAVWELSKIDAGAATLSLSGALAQMPIIDFGTQAQKDRYLGNADLRHAALCLTEPIPGAGTDAMFLNGSFRPVECTSDGELLLQIDKRGRFTSHMDFADFAVVAVQGRGDQVHGSCLIILEPGDVGSFDRGSPVHKIGHELASTTNPSFALTVPASRIVGGYTMNSGAVLPNYDHRQALEPAFRRTRSIMSLMTASKLLTIVQHHITSAEHAFTNIEEALSIVDLWATGEAAASLGFSSARLSDELDSCSNPTNRMKSHATMLAAAAKLFSTSHSLSMLQRTIFLDNSMMMRDDLFRMTADAQIEALYLGPEALQRRLLSAAMIDKDFLENFNEWTEEMDRLARSHPLIGIRALTEAMRLWRWSLDQLRMQKDERGARLYCEARQGLSFAMADALSQILAARSLTLDTLELRNSSRINSPATIESTLFFDLCKIASVRAASSVKQNCSALLFGYSERFPISVAARDTFNKQLTRVHQSLSGAHAARERIFQFLSAKSECQD